MTAWQTGAEPAPAGLPCPAVRSAGLWRCARDPQHGGHSLQAGGPWCTHGCTLACTRFLQQWVAAATGIPAAPVSAASSCPHLLLAVAMLHRVQSRRSSAGADKWLDVQVFDSAQVSYAGLLQAVCRPCSDVAA